MLSQDTPAARQALSHLRPVDYDGVMHARLTRKQTQARLPATARVILAEVLRAIPVGSWRRLSNATLAARLGFSESTVSRGMALLAAEARDAAGELINRTPFLQRRPARDGRPGYELSPLPPPELRPKPAPKPPSPESPAPMRQGAFFDPSISDPCESIPLERSSTPQTDPPEGSTVDGSIFLDHPCSGGMHGDTREQVEPDSAGQSVGVPVTAESPPVPSTPTDLPRGAALPEELPPQLAALGMHRYQWRALRKAAPGDYTLAALARDLGKLRTRPDVRRPPWLLRVLLERGEPVYSQAEIDAHNAELAALAGSSAPTPAKEVPRVEPQFDAPAPREPRRPAGRAGAAREQRPPSPSRDEFASLPGLDPQLLALLPRGRYGLDGRGHGDDSPADRDRALRE
jgi:hypothetical protein